MSFWVNFIEATGNHGDERKTLGAWIGDGFARCEVMNRGVEMAARCEEVSCRLVELGLDVAEIDAGERLLDVQVAWLAI